MTVRAHPLPSRPTDSSGCLFTAILLPLCNQETRSLHLKLYRRRLFRTSPTIQRTKRKIDHNVPVRTLFALTAISSPAIGLSTGRGLFTPLARRSAMRFTLKRWGVGLPQKAPESGFRPSPKIVEPDVVMVSSNFGSKQENIDR